LALYFWKSYFFTTFASMYQDILGKICYIIISTKTILPLKSLNKITYKSLSNCHGSTNSITEPSTPLKNTIIRHKKMVVVHDQRNRRTDVIELFPPSFPHIQPTLLQAFGHLPKMNNNLGQNRVRDKNIISPGWWDQPGLKVPCPTAIMSDIGRGDF